MNDDDPFEVGNGPYRTAWPEDNSVIFARDHGRCVIPVYLGDWRAGPVTDDPAMWRPCTVPAQSGHHRIHGNRSDHRPCNRLSVCGDGTTGHHGFIEAHPLYAMERGWTVTRYDTDPHTVPVWLFHPVWGLGRFILGPDDELNRIHPGGTWNPYEPKT